MTVSPRPRNRDEWSAEDVLRDARDGVTNGLVNISYEHHETHAGDHYSFSVVNPGLASSTTIELIMVAPDSTKETHLLWSLSGTLVTLGEMYENTTHNIGTEFTQIYNNDRNTANTCLTKVYYSDGGGLDGTRIDVVSLGTATGTGTNAVRAGGSHRSESEWILKRNTKYLLKIISRTNANNVNFRSTFYEHEDPVTDS